MGAELVDVVDAELAERIRQAFMLPPFKRGFAIEDALGRGSLPRNYPKFDIGKNSVGVGVEMTSIKSRDCLAKTYINPRNFVRQCMLDITTVGSFVRNPLWVHHEQKITILDWTREEIQHFSLIVVARGFEQYPDRSTIVDEISNFSFQMNVKTKIIAISRN